MTRRSRLRSWLLRGMLLAPVLFIAFVVIQAVLVIPYRHEHGYTYKGAAYEHYLAMRQGDAKEASYWAGRMVHYSTTGLKRPSWAPNLGMAFGFNLYRTPECKRVAYRSLGHAYELAGELQEAQSLYEAQAAYPLGAARVYRKLGRDAEAFRAYCAHALDKKREAGERAALATDSRPHPEQVRKRLEYFRQEIVGDASRRHWPEDRLTPFATYPAFMDFMQRMWEETGRDEVFREAMELLETAGPSGAEPQAEAGASDLLGMFLFSPSE